MHTNKLTYCIWGCANRGKHIFQFMKGRSVRAFIDSKPDLQGMDYQGVPIVSFDTYMREYRDSLVVIATFYQHEIVEILEKNQVPYFSSLQMPPEIVETPSDDFYKIVEKRLCPTGMLYFYGLNLYSVLLLEHFTEKGRTVKIIAADGERALQRRAAESLEDKYFGRLDEVGQKHLYITSNEYSDCEFTQGTPVNLYDFLYDIEEYHKTYLESYKNLHQGKRCFVIGTGPSLRMEDLDKLAESQDICISVNGIIKAFDSTKWRPTYYMLIDRGGFKCWKNELLGKCRMEHMLIGDCIEDAVDGDFEIFHLSRLQVGAHCPPAFTEDFSRGCYTCSAVIYCALQFAAYLGCSEIYLCGIDYDFSMSHNHFVSGYSPFDVTQERDLTKDPVYTLAQLRTRMGFIAAKKAGEERGFKIYNASRHTKLDVFERVDFDSLFPPQQMQFESGGCCTI